MLSIRVNRQRASSKSGITNWTRVNFIILILQIFLTFSFHTFILAKENSLHWAPEFIYFFFSHSSLLDKFISNCKLKYNRALLVISTHVRSEISRNSQQNWFVSANLDSSSRSFDARYRPWDRTFQTTLLFGFSLVKRFPTAAGTLVAEHDVFYKQKFETIWINKSLQKSTNSHSSFIARNKTNLRSNSRAEHCKTSLRSKCTWAEYLFLSTDDHSIGLVWRVWRVQTSATTILSEI